MPSAQPSQAQPSIAAQHSTAQHSTAQHSTAQHGTARYSTVRTIRHQELLIALVTIADSDFLARLGSLLPWAHKRHLCRHHSRHATAVQLQSTHIPCLVNTSTEHMVHAWGVPLVAAFTQCHKVPIVCLLHVSLFAGLALDSLHSGHGSQRLHVKGACVGDECYDLLSSAKPHQHKAEIDVHQGCIKDARECFCMCKSCSTVAVP